MKQINILKLYTRNNLTLRAFLEGSKEAILTTQTILMTPERKYFRILHFLP